MNARIITINIECKKTKCHYKENYIFVKEINL